MDLLTDEKISYIREDLANFEKQVTVFRNDLDEIISSFDSNDVVQSLYASGKFGQQEEEYIREIRKGVEDYYNLLTSGNGLINQTKKYLNEQENLNAKGGY